MKWEYLVIQLGLNRQSDLNKYGLNNWELITVIFEGDDIRDSIYPTAYFKRELREPLTVTKITNDISTSVVFNTPHDD